MGSALYAQFARGYNPLEQMQGVVNFQRGQTALQQERFNLQQAQLQPAYAGLNALLENPNASWNDVNAALANSTRLGGDVSGLVQNASDFAANGGNPADFIRQYGTARYVPPWEAANMFLPSYGTQGTAMGTYTGQVSGPAMPGGAQFTPQNFFAHGVSPEQWNQPVPVGFNPQTGQMITAPYGSVYGGTPGMGGEVGMGGGPATGGGAGGPVPGQGALGMIKQEALMNVMMRESGGRDIMNTQGSGAGGLFQMMPQTWAEGKQLAGIPPDAYPQAQGSPPQVQYAVASALYDRHGTAPWAASAANAGQFPGAQAAMLTANGIPSMGSGAGPVQNAAYYPPAPRMGGGMGPGGAAALPPGFTSIYGPGLTAQPPAPGVLEGARAEAGAATGRAVDLNAAASQVQATRSILEGMENDLRTPGAFTGVGAGAVSQLRQLAINMNMLPKDYQLEAGQSAQEHFNKLTAQLEGQTMQMLGAPSDARQEMAAASNPSALNSREGNLNIVHMLEGNLQAINVMQNAFLQSRQPAANFDQWRAKFTSPDPTTHGEFDPRTFWVANMNPQEQYDYLNNIKSTNPKAFTRMTNNLKYAVHQGWIYKASDNSIGSDW